MKEPANSGPMIECVIGVVLRLGRVFGLVLCLGWSNAWIFCLVWSCALVTCLDETFSFVKAE